MKFLRTVGAAVVSLALAWLASAAPALATVLYNSDNPTAGFDATANGAQPAGWASVSGSWRALNPGSSYSSYILPSHTQGFADSTRAHGSLAVLSGITALADQSVVSSQIVTVANTSTLQALFQGVRGNAGLTSGYLTGAQFSDAKCDVVLVIFKLSGTTYTTEASSGTLYTAPSCVNGAQFQVNQRTAVIGSTVYAKLWIGPATAEPSAWTINWTDSSPIASGYPWLYDNSSSGSLPSGPFITDFTVDDTPYGETNSISVATPATTTTAPYTITGAYQGTTPSGINYALDGATAYTAASSPTISGGAYSFALPAPAPGYHQVSVQVANAITETATTAAANLTRPATAYTLTGPPNLYKGQAATFTLAVVGTLGSADTVTLSDGGAGGSFSPSSPSSPVIPANSSGSSSVTFTYAPAVNGAVSISAPSDTAGLSAPPALNYTVTNPPVTVGALTAAPATVGGNSSIVVSLSAAAAGGSGSGYSYNLYRGTTANFAENSSTLLASGLAGLTYSDTAVQPGVMYYYGEDAIDSAGATVHALPAGFAAVAAPTGPGPFYATAQLLGADLNISYIGDSRTYCQFCTTGNGGVTSTTPSYWADYGLQRSLGLRVVNGYNGGCNGASSTNWLKTAAVYGCGSSNLYTLAAGVGASTGMAALAAADPGALQVFAIMLDANDANQGLNPATFQANLATLITSLCTDWPQAIVIVNEGSYISPTIYAGAGVQALAYSYRTVVPAMVASLNATFPGRVKLGDTSSWAYFARTYSAEMAAQASYGGTAYGTGYVHQNNTGAQSLGNLWEAAIAQDLYGLVGGQQFRPMFH